MNLRTLAIVGVIMMAVLAAYAMVGPSGPGTAGKAGAGSRPAEITYSELLARIQAGDIASATLKGDTIRGVYEDETAFTATIPYPSESVVERLEAAEVPIDFETTRSPWWMSMLGLVLPVLLLIGFWFWMMNRMQGGARGAMGFGKSKAKLLTEHKGRKTFDDVAGVDEAKEELQEVVDFLKDPGKFQKLGGKIPKGALLVGPPGTGKTLLARAVAGEAGVPFFSISGSDFVEMFVGVGASRVRDMFEQAKKNAPCIIFIDEIDAVGRHRGAGLGGGNDEREQTLNQLLVEMDGFESNEGIILIAATNRPDVLDPALLRPGRFDRQVVVPNPDVNGREKILRVHMKDVPLGADVNVKTIARGTPGFSGADLANLVNEAALTAARKDRRMVTHRDFEDAKDKVMMGAERKSMAMNEEEKKLTAYHEAGHAIVAMNVKMADPVHKATIVPRGRALGMVMQLPEGDRYSMKYRQMVDRIAIMAGGRVAEELIFGKDNITSGASSDIEQASKLARAMVTRWGFSEKLGTVAYGENQEEVFLGHSVARSQNVSEETARLIDEEVKRLVTEGWDDARRILTEKAEDHEKLSQALLEYETLSGDEIKDLLEKGLAPNRDENNFPNAGPSVAVPVTPVSDGVEVEQATVH
ncbi:ATP-dependent zinc metalloprotease FtsH [Brevundimonas sp. BAL450]|jgi:cell division protease FtsH|uniref:ATP-dependent zinc metalloprotease FtsH n=1 Tax=Brevundimonas abyssalis TAR-001 TaxID=1391729 RepID=A0A8E0TST9_9CAUL|nr:MULTISPECIES: ATP-dependent zinc metalloprotease FtsH [Brevundimonas]MBG7614497.1 ATP-dependent zinc metalloprotease FtsH [Brevundimonas sp. BAL450]GAD59651.1 cell division protein FtsH [Brevundimonas abyssalis TAR-001]